MQVRTFKIVSLVAAAALALAACGSKTDSGASTDATSAAPDTAASSSAQATTDGATVTGSAVTGSTEAGGSTGSTADTPELAALKAGGVLRVGTEGTYSPFTFHQDGSGPLTGYDIDVITAVAQELGLKVEFSETQWDSIFAGLDAGRYDVIANQVTVNDERKGLYDLSTPYTVSAGVVLTRSDDDSVKTLADIAGKKSAQSTTSNWAKVATDNGATVSGVEGFAQAVQLLKQKRVDVTINDSLAALEYFKTTGDTDIKIAVTTDDKSEQALAFKKNSGLVAGFDAALATLAANGTLATISEKYFGEDVSK
ncbi:amino acid ABC transporter substrate-binding protein [Nakamurella silvestris]|nr:amino acid ABC transporter substrate-binding protein [Nakamurella silvestris]